MVNKGLCVRSFSLKKTYCFWRSITCQLMTCDLRIRKGATARSCLHGSSPDNTCFVIGYFRPQWEWLSHRECILRITPPPAVRHKGSETRHTLYTVSLTAALHHCRFSPELQIHLNPHHISCKQQIQATWSPKELTQRRR
ncbi:immortalization up-regulated protein isoform X1 [Rana temporaria]|uniref:immortalization up-regulated protein isoform X1 n=1 Tax=Rana temporaria TaxID=8407 RepID=UPI001AADCBC5|nr:immortalization up-regulated protein isoform X1 [Rana temporaria]